MLQYDIGTTAAATSPVGFDLAAILGGVTIGRDVSGNFALSSEGLAVTTPEWGVGCFR